MATILVVDDKALNRNMLTTLLGYGGHRLLEASSGIEAIDKVRTENPDLIITDILMPHMDGYELVRRIRDLKTATPNSCRLFGRCLMKSMAPRNLGERT